MSMKNETGITPEVRRKVYARDSFNGWVCCIYCGAPSRGQYFYKGVEYESGIEMAHYIGRAQGGRGIPENLVCLCSKCHTVLDNGSNTGLREKIRAFIRDYLMSHYPDWNEKDLRVRK